MRREASRLIITNEQSNNAQAHLEGLFLMDFKKELDDHFNNKLKPQNVNGVDFGGKSYIIIKDCIQSYLDATRNSSSPRQYKPDSEDDDLNRSKVLQKKKITLIISKLLELDSPNTDLKTKHAYICTFYNVLSRKAYDYYWYNEKKYSKHYLLKAKEDFELVIGGTENEIHKQFLSIINDFSDKKLPENIAVVIFDYQLFLYKYILDTKDNLNKEWSTLLDLTRLTLKTDLQDLTQDFRTWLLSNIHIYLDDFCERKNVDVKGELLILKKRYSKWRKSSGVEEYKDNDNFYLYMQSANQKPPTTTSGNPNSFMRSQISSYTTIKKGNNPSNNNSEGSSLRRRRQK